jgi:hypothetical protein
MDRLVYWKISIVGQFKILKKSINKIMYGKGLGLPGTVNYQIINSPRTFNRLDMDLVSIAVISGIGVAWFLYLWTCDREFKRQCI